MPDSPTTITLNLHPHQVAALKRLLDHYPLVDKEQLLRLVLNVGLSALPDDGDAMMCLEAGNDLPPPPWTG